MILEKNLCCLHVNVQIRMKVLTMCQTLFWVFFNILAHLILTIILQTDTTSISILYMRAL